MLLFHVHIQLVIPIVGKYGSICCFYLSPYGMNLKSAQLYSARQHCVAFIIFIILGGLSGPIHGQQKRVFCGGSG